MRCSVICVLVVLPILVSTSTLKEHYRNVPMKELFEAISHTCAKKTGATPDDIKTAHDYGVLHTTPQAKCFVDCFMFTFGNLHEEDESEDFNLEAMYVLKAFKDEQEQKTARESFNKCHDKVPKNDDRCEYSHQLLKCFYDAVRAVPLHPISFWQAL